MLVYEDYKCYGPYTRSDGRQHVVLVHHNDEGSIDNRITCSYPKYIVERHLGRKLKSSETIDHIDGNFSNNNLYKGNNFIRKMNEYTSLRSLVQEIVSVEGANSGKSLVDNPEQD